MRRFLVALAIALLCALAAVRFGFTGPAAPMPLRFVFVAEDGTPFAGLRAQADIFPPPSARGHLSGWRGVTDEQGQILVLLPDARPWWVIVGIAGAAFFFDASKPPQQPEAVKCWLGAKPSVACTVEGTTEKIALFLLLEGSEWWVRLPPLKDRQLLLFNLPQGTHQVVLAPAQLLSYWSGALALSAPVQVTVREGQTTFLRLSAPPVGSIVGRVMDGQQRPITNALVTLSSDENGQLSRSTDAEGQFRFDGVPTGTYRLLVIANEFEAHERTIQVKAGETATVRVVLKSQQFGVVRGLVSTEDGSVPKEGRILVEQVLSPTMRQPAGVWQWHPDGRFEGRLTPSTYILTVQAGGRQVSRQVRVVSGQVTDLGKLVLPAPALVEGTVKSPIPLTNTRVRIVLLREGNDPLQPQWGSVIAEVLVTPYGTFRAEVPAEPLALVLLPFGSGKPLWRTVHPKPGQRLTVRFELPQMGAIEGQAVRADTGQPVANAQVFLLDDAGIVVGQALTNRLGQYRFEPLMPARYSLRCQAPGLAMGFRHNVRVPEGSRVPVDFVLTVGGSVVGTVKTKQKQPFSLYILVNAETQWMARVMPDGRFRIDHLPPGRHILMLFRLGELVSAKEVVVRSGEISEVVFEIP